VLLSVAETARWCNYRSYRPSDALDALRRKEATRLVCVDSVQVIDCARQLQRRRVHLSQTC
jgi:hypothetical protein